MFPDVSTTMPCPPRQIQELYLPLQTDEVLGLCSCSCTGNALTPLDPTRWATGSGHNHTWWLRHKNKARWAIMPKVGSKEEKWATPLGASSPWTHSFLLQHSGTHHSLLRSPLSSVAQQKANPAREWVLSVFWAELIYQSGTHWTSKRGIIVACSQERDSLFQQQRAGKAHRAEPHV